ncbi:MAG TPA: hypothetical protein VGO47_13140 [Chlamydiales bacterium]|nr:hypothetical protein [Chlamydiales bacterium]
MLHLGDLSFDTDIIGRCSDMSFVIECGDVQILLVDNRDCSGADGAGLKVNGMEYWKVFE